jgi:hypothetical protein
MGKVKQCPTDINRQSAHQQHTECLCLR